MLGFLIPTNTPDVFFKFFYPSLKNLNYSKKYIKFLFNFQEPWTQEMINKVLFEMKSQGFNVDYTFNSYEIKGKGLVPINQMREDCAKLDPNCDYYILFDDDMTFEVESPNSRRSADIQLIEALIYLNTYEKCGIFIFGSTLIKKIPRDTIAPVYHNRDYTTGRGLIFKNTSPENGLLLPNEAHSLLGSDEEKISAGYRLSQGYWVAELPFTRINHYEHQITRSKSGKIAGSNKYEWNLDNIRDANNFKFIRENYNPKYTYGRGNIVSQDLYNNAGGIAAWEAPEKYTMTFSNYSDQEIVNLLENTLK